MKYLNFLPRTFSLILKHLRTIDNYVVKSDDENIEMLLENDSDKVKFQNAIDRLISENAKSEQIEIKNRKITISI